MLRKFFKLDERNTSIKQESIAGVTTFLTMAYIIFVNPMILSNAGMDKGALITATILASALGTIIAGLWANVPFAMAPGMGLNAFFAFSLVIGKQISWETALGVVFISGVLFLILTISGVRAKVVTAIPVSLRLGIAAGIGLFIAVIGLQNLGLIVKNDATMISMGSFSRPVILGLVGLAIIAILEARKIKGSILISIVLTTIIGLIFKEVTLPLPESASEANGLTDYLKAYVALPPSISPIFLKIDILGALRWGLCGAIFSFMFVDLFDSVGTIVACAYEADMVEKNGEIKNINRILEADAVATIAGAMLGTSTTTAFIESGSGIAQGGRTGLSNIVTAMLFLAALLFTPLIAIVPAFATAPALIMVGVYMFKNISKIDFNDLTCAIPAFLTIILMPLSYNISTGIAFGFVSYVIIMIGTGRIREIKPTVWGISILAGLDLAIKG